MNSTHSKQSALRPAWTSLNILLMIVGFVVFWPIGLFMLAYMIWGDEWGLDLSDWGNVKERANSAANTASEKIKTAFDGTAYSSRNESSGNSAFDEWRRNELKRLDEERRKLEESRREFDKYVQELRRARDREEFEKFKSDWQNRASDKDNLQG